MRVVVQRVLSASAAVEGRPVGAIGPGLAVLAGFTEGDTPALAADFARKIVELRIFADGDGKMNRSIRDVGGAILAVSQFTLYADPRRGRRPSFDAAARPELAQPLYDAFCDAISVEGIECERGVFGAHMVLTITNDGPVTIILDSGELVRPRRT